MDGQGRGTRRLPPGLRKMMESPPPSPPPASPLWAGLVRSSAHGPLPVLLLVLPAASVELVEPVVLVTALVPDVGPTEPVELVEIWPVLVALAVPDAVTLALDVGSPAFCAGSSLVQQKSPSPSAASQWLRLGDRSSTKRSMAIFVLSFSRPTFTRKTSELRWSSLRNLTRVRRC